MRLLLIAALLAFTATSQAESILVVGDSLSCGHFGNSLLTDLAGQGHSVKMYCAVGSRPEHWLDGRPARASWPCEIHTVVKGAVKKSGCGGFPKFSKILAENPSDRVIVALGTNSLPGTPDATYDRMIDAVGATQRSCDWLLPPHLEPSRVSSPAQRSNLTRMDQALGTSQAPGPFYRAMTQKLNGRCSAIGSLGSTATGKPGSETADGIHHTAKGGRARFLALKPEIDRAIASQRTSGSSGRSRSAGANR